MTTDLKPCPFCGSRSAAFIPDESPAFTHGGRIRCDNCGAEGVPCFSDEGPGDQLLAINEKMAADHWNRRAR